MYKAEKTCDLDPKEIYWPLTFSDSEDPPPSYNGVVSTGRITLDTSYDSQIEKYENEMNMRNMHSKYGNLWVVGLSYCNLCITV